MRFLKLSKIFSIGWCPAADREFTIVDILITAKAGKSQFGEVFSYLAKFASFGWPKK
jgi:hypothetical protein